MTKRKKDPRIQVPPFIPRPHFACRLHIDIADAIREQCRMLNCSQGVWLEVAISKALLGGLVQQKDVFAYCADERWLHRVLDNLANGEQLTDVLIRAAHAKLSKVIPGQREIEE